MNLTALAEGLGAAAAPVATLAAAGISASHLGWCDADDALALAAPWSDALAPRLRTDFMQSRTAPVLRARHTSAAWIACETVPRKPAELATAAIFAGDFDPAAELSALEPTQVVRPGAAAAIAPLWRLAGVPCDRLADRAHPPIGPNVFSFSGSIAAGALPGAVAALGDRLDLLERHRALAASVAALAAPTRIGLEAVFDTALPMVWIAAAAADWDTAQGLVAAGLGDGARARRVVDAIAAAGATRPWVGLRLGVEEPVRVRVIANLEAA